MHSDGPFTTGGGGGNSLIWCSKTLLTHDQHCKKNWISSGVLYFLPVSASKASLNALKQSIPTPTCGPLNPSILHPMLQNIWSHTCIIIHTLPQLKGSVSIISPQTSYSDAFHDFSISPRKTWRNCQHMPCPLLFTSSTIHIINLSNATDPASQKVLLNHKYQIHSPITHTVLLNNLSTS